MDAVLANEPLLFLGGLLRGRLAGLYGRTLEETLAAGLWPKSYLEQLERLGEGTDVLWRIARSLREGERAAVLLYVRSMAEEGRAWSVFSGQAKTSRARLIERMLQNLIAPRGWIDQHCARFVRMHQFQLQGVDVAQGRLDARAIEAGGKQLSMKIKLKCPAEL